MRWLSTRGSQSLPFTCPLCRNEILGPRVAPAVSDAAGRFGVCVCECMRERVSVRACVCVVVTCNCRSSCRSWTFWCDHKTVDNVQPLQRRWRTLLTLACALSLVHLAEFLDSTRQVEWTHQWCPDSCPKPSLNLKPVYIQS
jgi:hypothetical protein